MSALSRKKRAHRRERFGRGAERRQTAEVVRAIAFACWRAGNPPRPLTEAERIYGKGSEMANLIDSHLREMGRPLKIVDAMTGEEHPL